MSDKAVELLDANIKDTENGTNGMGDGRGVVLGDERSATSLENMKRSMYILEETNLLRKQEGQSELRVNDHAMALSQVSVDIMTKWEHTQDKLVARYGESLAPSTGENLAAGTPGMTIEDTNGDGVINISMDADSEDYIYGGWYTREKAVYEYKQTHPEVTNDELDSMFGDHQTGHYLNIVGAYDFTGAAVGTRNLSTFNTDLDIYQQGFDFDFGQTYGAGWSSDNTMTVDEYKKLFMNYYNSVVDAKAKAEQAVADAKAALEQAQAEEGQIPADKQAALDAAEATYSLATQAVTDAMNTQSTANAAWVEAGNKLADANLAYAGQEVAISNAGETITNAEQKYQDATGNVTAKNTSLTAAQDALDVANAVLNNAETVVTEKAADVTDAQAAKDAEQARIDAQIQAQKDALAAALDTTDRDDKLAQAKAEYDDAAKTPTDAYNSAVEAASDAKATADSEAGDIRTSEETDAKNTYDASIEEAEGTNAEAKAVADSAYNASADTAEAEANAKKQQATDVYGSVAKGELSDAVSEKQTAVDTASDDLSKQTEVYNKVASDTQAVEQATSDLDVASSAVAETEQNVQDAQDTANAVKQEQDAVVADIDQQISDKQDEIYAIEHPEAVKSVEEVAASSENSTLVVAAPSETAASESAEQ